VSTEAHRALVRRYWQEASTRGLLAVIDDYFAPDVVAHPPASASPAPIRGLAAWKRFTSAQWGAFPDLTATVEDVVAEGDRVALRLTARGTHTGPLMGLPPTGKPVSFLGMEFFHIRDGKIVESWGQFDALSLLQQLGAVPGPPAAPDQPAGGPPPPPTPGNNGEPVASSEAHKALVRRYVDELLNRQRFEEAEQLLAPDFVGHFPGVPGPVRGVAGWKQLFDGFLAAFPDYRETVDDLVADGHRVAARIAFGGTHRGDLIGLPPTGKPVTVTGMAILRIAGGRIAEQWAAVDMLGLLQQLGAIPAPGQPGA
jgi:steroid delta-isomerase-like uncharacterized protein